MKRRSARSSLRVLKRPFLCLMKMTRLLESAINDAGGNVDPKNPRHSSALKDGRSASEQLRQNFGVLVGKAGTGETSILGALLSPNLSQPVGSCSLRPRVRRGFVSGRPLPAELKR